MPEAECVAALLQRLYLSASHRGAISICKTEKETRMYRTDFWTLWEKARVGCFERTASKQVYYLG